MLLKISISSIAPDWMNPNLVLNDHVANGLRAHLPDAGVNVVDRYQLEQTILLTRPDLVLLIGSALPPDANISRIRAACDRTSAKLFIWLLDDPYEFDAHVKILPLADAILVNDRWAASHYCTNVPVAHLPLAACPAAHYRPITSRRGWDVFFCGVSFDNRHSLLADLRDVLSKYNTGVFGFGWDTALLPFAKNSGIHNSLLPAYYNDARAVLNLGRTSWLANETVCLAPCTPGPRTFEAAMAGAAQLYLADGLEVERYFVPGEEILLFETVRDFELILARMSDEPEFSLSIGRAAQTRALREHTYENRARIISQLFMQQSIRLAAS